MSNLLEAAEFFDVGVRMGALIPANRVRRLQRLKRVEAQSAQDAADRGWGDTAGVALTAEGLDGGARRRAMVCIRSIDSFASRRGTTAFCV
jgi:hypothetical protein